jgi:hypothetical protein
LSQETLTSLWSQAKAQGWTFEKLAERTVHWKKTAVREMIMEGKGDALLEQTIRAKLEEILKKTVSVIHGRSESAVSGVADQEKPGEYLTAEEWKQRAIKSEEEVARLRAALHTLSEAMATLTAPSPSEKPVHYGPKDKMVGEHKEKDLVTAAKMGAAKLLSLAEGKGEA